MRVVAHVALVAAAVSVPHAAWAQASTVASAAETARVAALLSHHERMPEAAVFVSGGDAMATTLVQVYESEAQPTFVRVRALRALSYFESNFAIVALRAVIADSKAKTVFVHEAAAGLVRRAGTRALEFVAPLLARHDSRVRLSAVEALSPLGTPEVRTLFLARIATETDVAVRAALDSALLSMGDQ